MTSKDGEGCVCCMYCTCVWFLKTHIFQSTLLATIFLPIDNPQLLVASSILLLSKWKNEKLKHCINISLGIINFYDVHYIAEIFLLYPFFVSLPHLLLLMIKLAVFYIIVVFKESHEETETSY